MNEAAEVKLAPPGAGLPKAELMIARLLFGFRCLAGSRTAFNRRFAEEREAIRQLVASIPPEAAARRVLIPRVRGLEDSSRYWSVWMTLEHLRIVNSGIADLIAKLSRDEMPQGVASTAAVKPSPQVTARALQDYERSCENLLSAIDKAPNLKTRLRYAHPWFGPLDAIQWHALAGGHMGIHRVQIERIIGQLGS